MPVVSNDDPSALLSGDYWNGIEVTGTPVIVTYSFPTAAPAYDTSVDGFTSATVSSFQAFTPDEQAQAEQALGEWSAASGLIFIEVAPGQGDINFQNVDFSTTSYAGYGGIGFYPFGDWSGLSYPNFTSDLDASGDVFMNSDYLNPDGTTNYGTLLHEIGHAIGLKHPTEVVDDGPAAVVHDQVLSADDPDLTIMATVEDSTTGADSHLQPLDKAAAAFIYGPAGTGGVYTTSASGTNSVASWSWDATTQTLTQTALAENETIRGTSVNDIIYGMAGDRLFALDGNDTLIGAGGGDALYGGPGTDTLIGGPGGNDFYVYSPTTTVIENNAGSADTVYATVSFALPENVDTLYLYGQGLTGTANDQYDTLFGDGTYATTLIGGAGGDYMVGGAGDDTFKPGTGIDLIYGQGGNDSFVFQTIADAPIGADLTTIGDFTQGQDRIDLSGIKTTGADPGQDLTFIGGAAFTGHAGDVRAFLSGSNTIIEGDVNGDGTADFQIQLYGSYTLQQSDFVLESTPLCFLAGTKIATPAGDCAVEHLAVGDMVRTLRGEARRIAWIGLGRMLVAPGRRMAATPVIVRQGALGHNLPHQDLRITKAHALYLDDVLIPAEFLVNHRSIVWDDRAREVWLYHIELETHDVLLANGAPAESYRDDGNRWLFQNANSGWGLPPQEACAPVLTGGPIVDAVWRRLLDRAGPQDAAPTTDQPDLHLLVDGERVDGRRRPDGVHVFQIPKVADSVRIVSRCDVPAETGLARDPRVLGVAVRRVMLWRGAQLRLIDAADAGFAEGFHPFEQDNGFRWTSGNARLPTALFDGIDGPSELELHVGGAMRYRLDDAAAAAATPVMRIDVAA